MNQGRFLEAALASIFEQEIPVEVYVLDGGSTDQTRQVLERWNTRLAGWWSARDDGQSWAINRGIRLGSAPYVAWLNADDMYLRGGLKYLVDALNANSDAAVAYGKCEVVDDDGRRLRAYRTLPFSARAFANICFISQPGSLIRRTAWEAVAGVDESLDMCMDYDLWWRLFKRFGKPVYVRQWVAATRSHVLTKTATRRRDHYREAMHVVQRHWGRVPIKWYLAWPYKVWWLELQNALRRRGV
jgi:glycosyltransferase involved in cell wall biosynthesis